MNLASRRRVHLSRAMKGPVTNLFCNCMACTWQPVRVVRGDGHVRIVTRPIAVRELLEHHPHHFVCEPSSKGPVYHSGMLPLDMELEEGRMYLLLPLPRLLPHLDSTFLSPPPSCPCFSSSDSLGYDPIGKTVSEEDSRHVGGQLLLVVATKRMQKLRHMVIKSKLMEPFLFMGRRMLPQRPFQKLVNNLSKGTVVEKSVRYSCSRNRWRPGLECISEADLLDPETV